MPTDDHTNPRGTRRGRPVQVDALATRVISVLSSRQSVSAGGARQFVLDHLMRAALCTSPAEPDALISELRGHRLSLDEIIDVYVPQAARVLGQMWVNDELSFAQVTIGALRLQSVVEEASSASAPRVSAEHGRMTCLVIVPPDEQHFLGASVVAAQLRRLGCEVATAFGEDCGSLSARLLLEQPDLVLITCARAEALDVVRRTVQTVRNVSSEGCIIALGGAIVGTTDELKENTGVDIVTSRAADAVSCCARVLRAANRL